MKGKNALFFKKSLRPFRFLIVGMIATFVHLLTAALLLFFFKNAHIYLINLLAFLIAFVVSFYGHRYITYQVKGSVLRFFLVATGGFLVNNVILTVALWLSLPEFISIMIAVILVPVLTYVISSSWVFKS